MEIENANLARKQLSGAAIKLLTPKEAAQLLKVSESWLAKARMRGDGPPFIKIGRAIRYSEAAFCSGCERISTCQRANSKGERSRINGNARTRMDTYEYVQQ